MKTKMNLARGGGASTSKKLLAAIAVLAVAFVVFAAIPAVDADETGTPNFEFGKVWVKEDGLYKAESGTTENQSGAKDFGTMEGALVVANSSIASEVIIECEGGENKAVKWGANHLDVTRSLTVNGKGAVVFTNTVNVAGQSDFAIDIYQHLTSDITLTINGLHNVGVWGERSTNFAFNLVMTGCDTTKGVVNDGARVYISGATGTNNITLTDCVFGGNSSHCTVYSNAAGTISVTNCTFSDVSEPININSKTTGKVNISIKGCTFNDCGLGTVTGSMNGWNGDKSWSAPIRIVNSNAGTSTVKVDGCTFTYTGENSPANGDILVGEGRDAQIIGGTRGPGLTSNPVTLTVKDTKAQVQWQSPGYYAVGNGSSTAADQSKPVESSKGVTLNVKKDAAITVDSSKPVTGQIDAQDATLGGTVSTKDTKFDVSQIVTVNGTCTLVDGAIVTVEGKLVIPQGATLTVEAGAQLIVTGEAVVEGTLVIESSDIEGEEAGKAVLSATTVSGQVSVDGELAVKGDLVIEADAVVDINADGNASTDGGKVIVKASGTLNIFGKAALASIENAGTVVFDSEEVATGSTNVYMTADGAVVDLKRFTASSENNTLTVSDENLGYATDKTVSSESANAITVSVSPTGGYGTVAGLSFVQKVATDKDKNYVGSIDVSGQVSVTPGTDAVADTEPTATASIEFDGKVAVEVSGVLALGKNVAISNVGILKVSGTVDAVDVQGEPERFDKVSNSNGNDVKGTLNVVENGLFKASDKTKVENGNVNATRYETTVDKATIYNYAGIDAAFVLVNQEGNTVKDLNVLGKQTVTTSAKLPAGVAMTISGTLYIGEENGSDVRLDIVKDASVKGNGTIDVMGTLFAENKNNVKSTSVTVLSDVYSEQTENGQAVKNGWAKWTNVFVALEGAEAGEVIEVTRETGFITISESITIKDGVTLKIAEDKAPLFLKNGVTLTINGTLDTEADVYAEKMFGTTAMNIKDGKQSSAVVVNGFLFTKDAFQYKNNEEKVTVNDVEVASMFAGAPIAGAYYQLDGTPAVSSLKNASEKAEKIDIEKIVLNGAITAGDISFAGGEVCKTIEVSDSTVNDMNDKEVKTVLTISSLTLNGTKIVLTGTLKGAVIVGDASVSVDASGMTIEDSKGMKLSGTATGKSVALTAGTAVATLTSNAEKFTVATGAVLKSEGASFSALVIDGIVSVSEGKSLTAVDGVVTVNDGGVLSVPEATTTSSAGSATIATLNVGIDGSDYTGAAATVTGPVTVTGQIFAAPSVEID